MQKYKLSPFPPNFSPKTLSFFDKFNVSWIKGRFSDPAQLSGSENRLPDPKILNHYNDWGLNLLPLQEANLPPILFWPYSEVNPIAPLLIPFDEELIEIPLGAISDI